MRGRGRHHDGYVLYNKTKKEYMSSFLSLFYRCELENAIQNDRLLFALIIAEILTAEILLFLRIFPGTSQFQWERERKKK